MSEGGSIESALGELEVALGELENELTAPANSTSADETAQLAAEWEQLASEIQTEVAPLLTDLEGIRSRIETDADDLDGQLDGLVLDGDATELSLGELRDNLAAQLASVVASLGTTTERSGAVSDEAERTYTPVIDQLGDSTPTQLGNAQQTGVDAVVSLVALLESECETPVREGSEGLVGALATATELLSSSLERNREQLGGEATGIVGRAQDSSRRELDGLGSSLVMTLDQLVSTAQAIAEILQVVTEIKSALVDGVQLTNSGVQLVIDCLEEIDELLGGV